MPIAIKGFEWTTYARFGRDVALTRHALRHLLGVSPHSKVGIISDNRRERAIIVSAGYSLNTDDCVDLLNDSGCASLFCSTANVHSRARTESLSRVPLIRWDNVICLDVQKYKPHSFLGVMARAEQELLLLSSGGRGTRRTTTATTTTTTSNNIPEDLGIVAPSPGDLANLIYTSGTTGKPKGVELVHSNQVSKIKGCRDMGIDISDFPTSDDRSWTFLPFGRIPMDRKVRNITPASDCIALFCPVVLSSTTGTGKGGIIDHTRKRVAVPT